MLPLAFLALAAAQPAGVGAGLPNATDLMSAQVRQAHVTFGNGTVHCNRFIRFRAGPMRSDGTVLVRYREYVSGGRWRDMRAVLRRDGENWNWVEGDTPRCSISIIE